MDIFNKNYCNLEDLINDACVYCNIVANNELYSQISNLCVNYFWGEIYKKDFEKMLNKIKFMEG